MNTYSNENKENDEAMEVEDSRKTESISTPSTPNKLLRMAISIRIGREDFDIIMCILYIFDYFLRLIS